MRATDTQHCSRSNGPFGSQSDPSVPGATPKPPRGNIFLGSVMFGDQYNNCSKCALGYYYDVYILYQCITASKY